MLHFFHNIPRILESQCFLVPTLLAQKKENSTRKTTEMLVDVVMEGMQRVGVTIGRGGDGGGRSALAPPETKSEDKERENKE